MKVPKKVAQGRNARCLLAWGLPALVTLTLVLVMVVPWMRALHTTSDRLERVHDQIISYRQLLATLPSLQAELEQVKNREDVKAFYFAAATASLAGAELQSQVQDILRAAEAQPISTQILPVDGSEKPARIRIRIQFKGSVAAVFDVLYLVEAARPFLFIDQMSLRSSAANTPIREIRTRPGQPPPQQARERDELTLRLDIFGFALVE